jgi:hypothetical protein
MKKITILLTVCLILSFVSINSYGQLLIAKEGSNSKWGFVDKTGKEVIPFKYDAIGKFSEGLCAVRFDWYWGFVDFTGKEVIPCKYIEVGEFFEGLCAVAGPKGLFLFF